MGFNRDRTHGNSASTAVVTITAVSTIIAPSDLNALKRIVFNNSGSVIFVKLGEAATTSSFTYRLTANTGIEIFNYTGIISAVRGSGTSPVIVTTITP